ncbi:protein translocase subunit SecF [Candidatus Shapirobacteria bacterium CG10_big_fil_rev_8_21_14_0_10_40_9]|uniref:Protein-export membrane protein SecF n=1 Tax=Candidatus Shapirobacteria bacterium CG10_big_fil_rev_8_21_14_0_10_40_9 TaxID=1974888 RepID=A0A2M8L4J0_9BACT|nr:MAG: protein translocase subunit SecF [Candidatus Shapirobacteria bacterium CG10_big_fil_rev_8_21_14_0_10_40_9]
MNFMRYKWLYFLLSAVVLIPGIFSLVLFGLRPSIDFTGGSLLELKFSNQQTVISDQQVKEVAEEKGFAVSSVQVSGEKTFLLRFKPITKDDASTIKAAMAEKFAEMPEELRFETVGPILGQELLIKTAVAIVLAAGFILGYVAWAFKNAKFGICAILAMFHDSLVLLGSFSLLGHFLGVEVDTLFVTAMLTILSFSVHDTVVVYDRIRESQKRFPQTLFSDLVNKAVTETLSRSLNNSLTIIFMLVALLFLGGTTIKWFVFALLIGTISGTYSSTFTAAPLLVLWSQIEERRKK